MYWIDRKHLICKELDFDMFGSGPIGDADTTEDFGNILNLAKIANIKTFEEFFKKHVVDASSKMADADSIEFVEMKGRGINNRKKINLNTTSTHTIRSEYYGTYDKKNNITISFSGKDAINDFKQIFYNEEFEISIRSKVKIYIVIENVDENTLHEIVKLTAGILPEKFKAEHIGSLTISKCKISNTMMQKLWETGAFNFITIDSCILEDPASFAPFNDIQKIAQPESILNLVIRNTSITGLKYVNDKKRGNINSGKEGIPAHWFSYLKNVHKYDIWIHNEDDTVNCNVAPIVTINEFKRYHKHTINWLNCPAVQYADEERNIANYPRTMFALVIQDPDDKFNLANVK